MVQWGEYLSSTGSMQPFVLYSLSGLAIAVFFVATIFTDPTPSPKVRWVRYGQAAGNTAEGPIPAAPRDPVEIAVNVTQVSEHRTRADSQLVSNRLSTLESSGESRSVNSWLCSWRI